MCSFMARKVGQLPNNVFIELVEVLRISTIVTSNKQFFDYLKDLLRET